MANVKRRAPKKGYDNEVKQEYRENVWSHMAPKVIPLLNQDENAKVLLLPSKEGLEIDVAIKHGINPNQIIAIDENPALLAHAQWKDKIPKENRFGCKVSKIGEKIKNNGWYLVGANLDFCNNFSYELVDETQSFLDTNCYNSDEFYIAITLMKGRESRALLQMINKFGEDKPTFSNRRLSSLIAMCELKDGIEFRDVLFEGEYFDTSPMAYGIVSLMPKVFNFSKNDAEQLINRYKNKDEWNTLINEANQRFDNYTDFINEAVEMQSKIKSDDEWIDVTSLLLKHKMPKEVWFEYAIGEISYQVNRAMKANLKQWIKGNLNPKRFCQLYTYLDEYLDLDLYYVFFGIPRHSSGDGVFELDYNVMFDIGCGEHEFTYEKDLETFINFMISPYENELSYL